MKNIYILIIVITFIANAPLKAQILNVNEIFQEQDQWCWAGSSACVLDYYSATTPQCEIAEYTRTVSTWHNFGTTDCCDNASLGCNYWNYNWGCAGSIQDILVHFAYLLNDGVASSLSQPEVINNFQANRLFIIRWGWTGGGGHFIVGHGISGNNLYYMDPWFGEGKKIATYAWVCSGSSHTWTHTNILTNVGISKDDNLKTFNIYPNPVNNELNIEFKGNNQSINFEIINSLGQLIDKGKLIEKTVVETSLYSPGMYLIKLANGSTYKFVKNVKE